VRDGLPELVEERDIRGVERLMRLVYDHLAPLHDPLSRWLVPLLQSTSERAARERYMRRLELGRLGPRADGEPLRVLEVGVGTGANLPLVERDLPPGLDVELWGVDFSRGMLAQCRARLARHTGRPLRLLLADAHALPFRDGTFDRVFHVGGIAAYRDARVGLAEMARVARPGTPIVVVDEQLDPRRRHGLHHRLAFRALTFYDRAPRSPVALLPPEATDVVDEQVTRFYYCLTFRRTRPGAPAGRP
jgi:ubiquinone/menaquinone biosynthesis C-methylase UbiE